MSETPSAAQDAIDRHAWSEAFVLLTAADSKEDLSPEGLELLGLAAWWNADIEACIGARERAYAGFLEQANEARAGMMCLHLAEDHFHRLAASVGAGWLKRAERLLEKDPETLEYGWLARMQAVIAYEERGDIEGALERARVANDTGDRFDNGDLQALSLHDQGRIMVADGRVEEGLALMEEAMVGAVGGNLDATVTGRIYCNMIDTCERLADYRRASEWDEEARRWCERVGHDSGFPGICRVKRADLLRLRGAWTEAEAEARRACDELGNFLDFAGRGNWEIGEIRMRLGDFAGAEEAFQKAHELGHNPEPGRALLRLKEGDHEVARELLDQALNDIHLPLDRARLLPAWVEILVAAGDFESAEEAASELQAVADEFNSVVLQGGAAHSRGLVALGRGRADEAVEHLREAWKLRSECELPYEAAQSRLSLGLAYRERGAEEIAKLEIEAARSSFERLGAEPDLRAATELLTHDETSMAVRTSKALMFTDIVGSTNLVETIGDEAWTHLIRWHDRTLRSAFEDHEGVENDHAGDGFFVVFPSASAAIGCAVDIQSRLHRHRNKEGFSPEVRIGIHCAEVMEAKGKHTGVEIHKAARIAALAGAGQILASREAAEGLGAEETGGSRSVSLKGIEEPVELVEIKWR